MTRRKHTRIAYHQSRSEIAAQPKRVVRQTWAQYLAAHPEVAEQLKSKRVKEEKQDDSRD